MTSAVLVTGTDTGVGKTLVSCSIAAGLHARGLRVGVYKPVETGCERNGGTLSPSDVPKLLAAAGAGQAAETAVSYLFELPAAPLVAAEAAGSSIDPLRIAADFTRLAERYDVVIVEGAGGLLVPIARQTTYLDLARQLALPVVCVIGSRLGCINHALLTLGSLEEASVPVHGFVMNQLEPGTTARAFAQSNRDTIARFTHARDLGLSPYVPDDQRDDLAALASIAADALDLDRLI